MPSTASAQGSELFIYYRADVADAPTVAGAVHGMQAALCARHPGLTARLLRRPEAHEGQHTWMEAYALPAGADALALAALIEQHANPALAPWLSGPRHVEHFIACAS